MCLSIDSHLLNRWAHMQSRGSAKLFLQSLELLGLPYPLTRRRLCPPPLVPGGVAHSLAGEEVGEGSQFQ
jgi:hypothetical protein